MNSPDAKAILHRYLTQVRQAVLWKLDGLSDYEVRRPLVPTGTNLLGLVKHLACVELGYFGICFGRTLPAPPPWSDDDPTADMWATEEESRDAIIGLYRTACALADDTIAGNDLDARARVPWWPEERSETTLEHLLVHVVTETNRHCGQADIVRELIDGAVGLNPDRSNLPDRDGAWWAAYRARLEETAARVRIDG